MESLAEKALQERCALVEKMQLLSAEGRVADFQKDVVSTLVRLCGKILAADGRFRPDESDFLNHLTFSNDSYEYNAQYVEFCEKKWDWFRSHEPEFIKAARCYDQKRQTNLTLQLVEGVERIGLYAAASDAEGAKSEVLTLTEYIQFLKGNGETKQPDSTVFNATVLEQRESGSNTQCKTENSSETIESLLQKLNALIGLTAVKTGISNIANLTRIRKLREERGMKISPLSLHLVFTGNPGTGKTTVARLVARIYKSLGILKGGQLIETDRSGLIGGYLGQTALKVQDVVKTALNGTLFIDEAYSLTRSADTRDLYGHEAVDTLLKLMEDHRERLVVIVAGYTTKMAEFIDSNPGLRSRFNNFIEFEDYSPQELYDIFVYFCTEQGLTFDEITGKEIYALLKSIYETRTQNFANARTVRNLFEKVLVNQATRLASQQCLSNEELSTVAFEDIPVLAATEKSA